MIHNLSRVAFRLSDKQIENGLKKKKLLVKRSEVFRDPRLYLSLPILTIMAIALAVNFFQGELTFDAFLLIWTPLILYLSPFYYRIGIFIFKPRFQVIKGDLDRYEVLNIIRPIIRNQGWELMRNAPKYCRMIVHQNSWMNYFQVLTILYDEDRILVNSTSFDFSRLVFRVFWDYRQNRAKEQVIIEALKEELRSFH